MKTKKQWASFGVKIPSARQTKMAKVRAGKSIKKLIKAAKGK